MNVDGALDGRWLSENCRDRLQRGVALVLLIGLVWGIGSFYSKEQIRWLLCEYRCHREDVPNRMLREFLNGGPDRVYQDYERNSGDGHIYDEDSPVDNPAPDNLDHYYAALPFNEA